jgi:hypothetical protein
MQGFLLEKLSVSHRNARGRAVDKLDTVRLRRVTEEAESGGTVEQDP